MKRTKRFLAMLMLLILCVGEISSTGLRVFAAGEEELTEAEGEKEPVTQAGEDYGDQDQFEKNTENTMLGTSGMAAPVNPVPDQNAYWQGSYVYYGKYNNKPVKYCVLDRSTTVYNGSGSQGSSMLLFSGSNLYTSKFDDASYIWKGSYVQKGLETFLSESFTETEENAIQSSYKAGKSQTDGEGTKDFVPLTGEKLFFLDAVEAMNTSYGFSNDNMNGYGRKWIRTETAERYWLRTGYLKDSYNNALTVNHVGQITNVLVNATTYIPYVRPSFNVKLSNVIFATAVEGKKGEVNTEYKLTLASNGLIAGVKSGEKTVVDRQKVDVPYWIGGNDAPGINRISVLILDKAYTSGNSNGAKILYYDKLAVSGNLDSAGKGSFTLPSTLDPDKWGSDYRVYILAEKQSSLNETDYASAPVEITKSNTEIIKKEVYNVWVGDTQVDEDNMNNISCEDGYASFNPGTNTLTFHDARLLSVYKAENNKTMGIVAKDISLTIKGTVTIDVTGADIGIDAFSKNTGDVLTLDGDITINGTKTGILAEKMDMVFAGGRVEINNTKESAVKASFDGKIKFGEGMDILTPADAALVTTNDKITEIHESTNSGSPVVTTAVIGQTSGYNLWVNGIEVTASNKSSITCGSGTASYEPSTQTLTFNNATISDGYEYNTTSHYKAGIYSRNNALIIKGDVIIDNTEFYTGINCYDLGASDRVLTLDGDIKINVKQYGVNTTNKDVKIAGSKLDIESGRSALNVNGDVSLGAGIKVLSPEGGVIKENADYSRVYESESGTTVAKNAVIGTEVNIVTYTVTFDLNGKSGTAPAAQTVEKGKTVSKPSDPSAEGFVFVDWCTDKEGKNVYDFATPVTADITLYAKWAEASVDTFTVTFDLNGKSGTAPAAQTVEKGKTVSKPSAPSAEGFKFVAWCTDKEGKNEYDFSTPVTADITLYAKWEKAEEPVPGPDPIDGGKSALDPVPELVAGVTKELYLVKGQKFDIGQGWYVDKADKDSKKRVSISKKGAFKAKAEGEAVIKCGSGVEAWEVKLHISKPKMDKKSLKIQLETETEVKTEKIGFTYDKDNLDVLWYSANPDVVTVDDSGNVTTVGKGSSKVTAYINGSAYTCTVTVKEKAALLEHTLHVAKGASKSISIKGLKKPQWEDSVKDIVSVKKNKVTGVSAGTTVLSFTQDEKVYKVTVIVEDLTMSGTGLKAQGKPGSNKYIIDELKAKEETILSFAGVTRAVVFKSSKPDIAFIDEDLNVVIRNKGKAKFTAKINGKPVTISVNIK
ncbi:MAG: InlB B-repeat-containing protein [Lachnospiraceae bacterium]|nr:InlB B-repeat-containing protein [Lachnospiraceae bacterium]